MLAVWCVNGFAHSLLWPPIVRIMSTHLTDSEYGYGREAAWERNLLNLESGSLGDPEKPETLLRYWQLQERAHYPYAKENADYFKELLAPKQNESEENHEKEN